MKWKRGKGRKSDDVIDIRGASKGSSGGSSGGLGGMSSLPVGIGGIGGTAGVVIVLVIVAIQVFGGGDSGGVGAILGGGSAPGAEDPEPIPPSEDPQRDLRDFSAYVFEDTQSTWEKTFAKDDESYDDAQLVLYADRVSTGGCGNATSAVGPFYCPGDSRVYLDLSFYDDMESQLDASGDFAWAYVIAHEMGHHVQNELGLDAGAGEGAEGASVRTELQADCYAGVWASTVFAEGDLEKGDLDEAFTASEAVGDDRLQEQATGSVNPDTFTHGTSEQRHEWFETGYDSADPSACDTFSAEI